ncbi:hypothetical protein [Leptolyngbya ohadii]|nr:hypothetical protein [Leptolyngbya ohadii]
MNFCIAKLTHGSGGFPKGGQTTRERSPLSNWEGRSPASKLI